MRAMVLGLFAWLAAATAAESKDIDPEDSLRNIITAFQRCGPPEAYQALSPSVFQAVAQQTGGSGCYAPIAAAGPIQDVELIEEREFPVGPLYVMRVTHQSGPPADWFIGFNNTTGKIEYLTFQAVVGGKSSSIAKGPDPNSGGIAKPKVVKPPPPTTSEACKKFPVMCP